MKQFKNEAGQKKGGFLVLLGTLGASLLGYLSTGKETITVGENFYYHTIL